MRSRGWYPPWIGFVVVEEEEEKEILSLHLHVGKAIWTCREKAAPCKLGSETSLEPDHADTLISYFEIPEPWENTLHFYCISYPVYGILLWQPNEASREDILGSTGVLIWVLILIPPSLFCGSRSFMRLHFSLYSTRGVRLNDFKDIFYFLKSLIQIT